MSVDTSLLDTTGPVAPPRANGELVFAASWEARAFGLAVALHAGGIFAWEDFRRALVAVIADREARHGKDEPWSYYRCWLDALERVLVSTGRVTSEDLLHRSVELGSLSPGHDHRHT